MRSRVSICALILALLGFSGNIKAFADELRPVNNVETLVNYLSNSNSEIINLVDVVTLVDGAPVKVLTNNTNFNESAAPPGGFSKTLDGNGLTISGLTSPLIGFMDSATVRNINFTNSNIQSGGVVASYIQNSSLTSVTVSNTVINGSASPITETALNSNFKEVKVESATITSSGSTGGLIGTTINSVIESSTVTNVTINGESNLSPVSKIGGVVGDAQNSTIVGPSDTLTVSGLTINLNHSTGSGFASIGGITGSASGTPISQVRVELTVQSNESSGSIQKVGGIAGETNSPITNSTSKSEITLPNDSNQNIGGIAGTSTSTIESSTSVSNISLGQSINVGGIAGSLTSGGVSQSNTAVGKIYIVASSTTLYVGGAIGSAESTTAMTSAAVNINVTASGEVSNVGGLVGNSSGAIRDTTSSGNINISAPISNNVGGLVGNASGSIVQNSFTETSTVSVNSASSSNTGGLVGNTQTVIVNSFSSSSVTGNTNVGGLIGSSSVTDTAVVNSYATGNVIGTTNVGGLIGNANGNINHAYATGNVQGENQVGGLVGIINSTETSKPTISTAYSTGNVTGSRDTGGLVGKIEEVRNCTYVPSGPNYYDPMICVENGKNRANIYDSDSVGNVVGQTNAGALIGSNQASQAENIQNVNTHGTLSVNGLAVPKNDSNYLIGTTSLSETTTMVILRPTENLDTKKQSGENRTFLDTNSDQGAKIGTDWKADKSNPNIVWTTCSTSISEKPFLVSLQLSDPCAKPETPSTTESDTKVNSPKIEIPSSSSGNLKVSKESSGDEQYSSLSLPKISRDSLRSRIIEEIKTTLGKSSNGSKLSDEEINTIKTSIVFAKTFLDIKNRPEIEDFIDYGFEGINIRTLPKINQSILDLYSIRPVEISDIQVIVREVLTLDLVLNPESQKKIRPAQLMKLNFFTDRNLNTSRLTSFLRKTSTDQISSYKDLQNMIFQKNLELNLKKLRFLEIKSRIMNRK